MHNHNIYRIPTPSIKGKNARDERLKVLRLPKLLVKGTQQKAINCSVNLRGTHF